ncbi:MAG: hypothetical protein KGI27_09790 [Thaumarchaeota archaeon]|nr:hypothetical protein [Nitrososphaerota archaeon]
MQNIAFNVKGSILTVTLDLAKEGGQSKSGKSTVVGSTQGNQLVHTTADGKRVMLGVNCYKI